MNHRCHDQVSGIVSIYIYIYICIDYIGGWPSIFLDLALSKKVVSKNDRSSIKNDLIGAQVLAMNLELFEVQPKELL